jgi:hypothetical protein
MFPCCWVLGVTQRTEGVDEHRDAWIHSGANELRWSMCVLHHLLPRTRRSAYCLLFGEVMGTFPKPSYSRPEKISTVAIAEVRNLRYR